MDPEKTNQKKAPLLDTKGSDSHAMELQRTLTPEQVRKECRKTIEVLEEGHWLEESAYSANIRTKASILWLVVIVVLFVVVVPLLISVFVVKAMVVKALVVSFGVLVLLLIVVLIVQRKLAPDSTCLVELM